MAVEPIVLPQRMYILGTPEQQGVAQSGTVPAPLPDLPLAPATPWERVQLSYMMHPWAWRIGGVVGATGLAFGVWYVLKGSK